MEPDANTHRLGEDAGRRKHLLYRDGATYAYRDGGFRRLRYAYNGATGIVRSSADGAFTPAERTVRAIVYTPGARRATDAIADSGAWELRV